MLPMTVRGMDLILRRGPRMSHAVGLKKKKRQIKIGSPSVNNVGSHHISEEILESFKTF